MMHEFIDAESGGDECRRLRDEYRLRFDPIAGYRNAVWTILCTHYFERFIPHSAHVLDLGCGWCEFINHIGAVRKYAMDLNPDAALRVGPDVSFLQQDCSREWDIPDGSLDVVFTSNFLEHLPTKRSVENTLAQAHRCLKPGGTILCMGPNIKYLPGCYWDFWDHYIPLSEQSLAEVLRMGGYIIQTCIPRFLPYSMSQGRTPPPMFLKAYLRMPWIWPLFGRQFLVIGGKPPASGVYPEER